MASLTTIKRRIASINSTAKITNAMYLVASSKLRKIRSKYDQIKEYFNEYYSIVGMLLTICKDLSFLKVKDAKDQTLYVQINSSMGLCGAYNTNVNKLAKVNVRPNDKVICIGKKGREFWTNEKGTASPVIQTIDLNENQIDYGFCDKLSHDIITMYQNGEINSIKLIYTKFINALSFQATVMSVLPFDKEMVESLKTENINAALFEFEPNENTVLENLLPQYVSSILYGSLIESKVSEYGSRRNAMDTATTNAFELDRKYRLVYNAARQAKITNEIIEIVAGSNNDKEN